MIKMFDFADQVDQYESLYPELYVTEPEEEGEESED